ncbi:hypothetical protein CEUSTIGMA_g2531.t1 [Chlamydomonas eustigma]|uniref:Uncharacterized protein n=1 Tax=Chlamydomonas eustigma TaxID=1157962 RepID=A0A250WW77_9CHLO|nr:hypothetical protein CEUSTIGMA_g2531.t1 [Chlamydomonas eustigma]|eukprot:GAX75087.1 hypothetical protein CEUSTIGMA_g2531.t1 [Chlamydomonas eustigma]
MAGKWTTATTFGFAMRIAVVFFIAVGVALIAFGCVLQNPPKDYAPILFVVVGSLNLFSSLAGLWGSYNKKRILLIFIIFGGLSVLLQIAFTISLFTLFDRVTEAIAPTGTAGSTQEISHNNVSRNLNIMRWVSIGFIFFEILTCLLAILLKWVVKEDDDRYTGFDDESNEQRQVALSTLRGDIEKNAVRNERAYDKIRDKLAAKYGALAPAGGDWRAKTKVSWIK